MGLYYRLDHKKTTSQIHKNEEVRVVIDYYYNGKRTKITTNVSCLVKDWDKKWRGKTMSPYMLMVKKIQKNVKLKTPKEYWELNYWDKLYTNRSKLQSITHVDFSARIQTVSKKTNPRYWSLIDQFKKLTGVGVLINTSFNVRGEPIVNTPEDAFKCFMNTGIDYLVIEKFIYTKVEQNTKIKRNVFKMD